MEIEKSFIEIKSLIDNARSEALVIVSALLAQLLIHICRDFRQLPEIEERRTF